MTKNPALNDECIAYALAAGLVDFGECQRDRDAERRSRRMRRERQARRSL